MCQEITTIDAYINQYTGEIKERLITIRKTIMSTEPRLQEKISWNMPTFWLHKNVIHFAVSKNHIGIYPGALAIEYFQSQLTDYKTSKGTIQLPHTKPIPYDLIVTLVTFNVEQFT